MVICEGHWACVQADVGAAKILASVLFVIAIPALIGCVLFAGGLLLLIPVLLVAGAIAILKAFA